MERSDWLPCPDNYNPIEGDLIKFVGPKGMETLKVEQVDDYKRKVYLTHPEPVPGLHEFRKSISLRRLNEFAKGGNVLVQLNLEVRAAFKKFTDQLGQ